MKSRTQKSSGVSGAVLLETAGAVQQVSLDSAPVTSSSKQPYLPSLPLEPLGALDFVIQAHAWPPSSDFQRQELHVRLAVEVWWAAGTQWELVDTYKTAQGSM